MSKETEGIIAAIGATKIEHVVTDINGPGHAARGNHYRKDCSPFTPFHKLDILQGKVGRAVDFAHRRHDGKRDTPELLKIYKFFLEYAKLGLLDELYYSGPGADYCVRGGTLMLWTDVPASTRNAIRRTHHDHVHVAVKAGVFLVPVEEQAQVEEADMIQYEWNDGAIACVNAIGEVFCPEYEGRPTARHRGGMNDLRADAKRTFTVATSIVGIDRNDSQAGYIIKSQDWKSFWKFDDSIRKFMKK